MKTKRMSEIFHLPIPLGDVESFDDIDSYAYAVCGNDNIEKQAAHAINHVDALADALELLLKELGETYIHNSNLSEAESKAEDALKAYRGEK